MVGALMRKWFVLVKGSVASSIVFIFQGESSQV